MVVKVKILTFFFVIICLRFNNEVQSQGNPSETNGDGDGDCEEAKDKVKLEIDLDLSDDKSKQWITNDFVNELDKCNDPKSGEAKNTSYTSFKPYAQFTFKPCAAAKVDSNNQSNILCNGNDCMADLYAICFLKNIDTCKEQDKVVELMKCIAAAKDEPGYKACGDQDACGDCMNQDVLATCKKNADEAGNSQNIPKFKLNGQEVTDEAIYTDFPKAFCNLLKDKKPDDLCTCLTKPPGTP